MIFNPNLQMQSLTNCTYLNEAHAMHVFEILGKCA